MPITRAYKVRLRPNKRQERRLWDQCMAVNAAWNWYRGKNEDINMLVRWARRRGDQVVEVETGPLYPDILARQKRAKRISEAKRLCKDREYLMSLLASSELENKKRLKELRKVNRKAKRAGETTFTLMAGNEAADYYYRSLSVHSDLYMDYREELKNSGEPLRHWMVYHSHVVGQAHSRCQKTIDDWLKHMRVGGPLKKGPPKPRHLGRPTQWFQYQANSSHVPDRRHIVVPGPQGGKPGPIEVRVAESVQPVLDALDSGAKLGDVIISRNRAGEWYASIQVVGVPAVFPKPKLGDIGVDWGVAVLAATSEAEVFESIDVRDLERRKEELQRMQSRCKGARKGERKSRRWLRLRDKLAKVEAKIGRVRRDRINKLTTNLMQYSTVYVENLDVLGMTASAKGDSASPGRGVAAKAGLNRSILRHAPGEIARQLKYKAAWYGVNLVFVDPRHTSQRCFACGCVDRANRVTQSLFRCVDCGYEDNADVNAAKNIRYVGRTGKSLSPCRGQKGGLGQSLPAGKLRKRRGVASELTPSSTVSQTATPGVRRTSPSSPLVLADELEGPAPIVSARVARTPTESDTNCEVLGRKARKTGGGQPEIPRAEPTGANVAESLPREGV